MDIASKSTGDQHTAAEMNQVVNELEYSIEAAGLTLDDSDTTQLRTSMGIVLLNSATGVNVNDTPGDEQTLYTVPTGLSAIITHVVVRNANADTSLAVGTFGIAATSSDEFRSAQTFTPLDDATKYVVVYPDQGAHDTPEGGVVLTAGQVFVYEVVIADGDTVTMDVFGYTF